MKQLTVISKSHKLFNGFGFQHNRFNKYSNNHIALQKAHLIVHKTPNCKLEAVS